MADTQTPPAPVKTPSIATIKCDLLAGPKRCMVHFATGASPKGIKAIWRNEVGRAKVTGPRVPS